MKKRFAELLRSRFLRNAGAVSAGAAIVQVVAFLASLLLTRLYQPDDFGVLAVFLAFVTFSGAISSLHYEMAIALPKEDVKGAAVTVLALTLTGGFAVLSLLVFAPIGFNLLNRLNYGELQTYWWLLPATIFVAGSQQVLALWNSRRSRFLLVAQNSIIQSITQNAVQIGLGIAQVGSLGLLIGITIGRLLSGTTLLFRRWPEDRRLFKLARQRLIGVASEFRSLPLIGLWGAILHVTCFQIPALLLVDFFEPRIAGWYLLQERVLTVPLTVLAQGVASVFYVNAARLAHENPGELRLSYFRILKNLSLLGILPSLSLLLFGPPLFKFIFGAEWETAGEYARIFAIPTFLRFVAGPLFRCLTILNRQGWIFVFDGIGLLFMLGATVYLTARGYGPTWVVGAVAIGISLAYGGLLIASTAVVISYTQKNASEVTGRK